MQIACASHPRYECQFKYHSTNFDHPDDTSIIKYRRLELGCGGTGISVLRTQDAASAPSVQRVFCVRPITRTTRAFVVACL